MGKKNIKLILLLLIGTISWSITMVKSGLIYGFGMGFWGANGHDGVWHIALINSLARGSLQMPTFSGFNIKNYHLGFDLGVAFLHAITKLSVVNLYFQIIPPVLAFFIGLTCYLCVYVLTQSKRASIWATFFIYFGGDISWILGKGESTFWSQQAISTLINPPFALSLVIIFLGLILIAKKEKGFFGNIFCIILFGILFETKAYAGVLVLISLLLAGIWGYVKENRIDIFLISLFSLGLTLILFFVLNRGSENVFVFSPFWFLQTLFAPDRLSFPKLFSAITNYSLANNWVKLYPAYFFALFVFLIGNVWTRLIFIFRKITFSSLDIFIYSMILGGIAIPLLFIQKGTPWNTIQFFYYSLTMSAILAGMAVDNLFKKRSEKFIYVGSILIIILTIPTTIITLKDVYIPSRPPAKISSDEFAALDFLSKQSDGVVLTYPYDSPIAQRAINNPPRPLYLYDSTAYVGAFSNHPIFLEDQVNLDITNFDWKTRRKEIFDDFLDTHDQNVAFKFLKDNTIKYIYLVKPQKAKLVEVQLGLTKIFENNEVNIFKVQ